MKKLAAKFLSDNEKEKIINAVKEAEKTTSGEIVPMVVSSSYNYPMANLIGGLIFGLVAGLIYAFLDEYHSLWIFLAVFMVVLILMNRLIEHIPWLKRLFLFKKEIEEEVHEAAVTSFFENELYKTRDETGVLIFISVFERKVWLLADKGINSKIDKSEWQNIVDDLIKGIKEKKQGDAIVEAVKRVGEKLSSHFPIKKDDTDELENLVIKD